MGKNFNDISCVFCGEKNSVTDSVCTVCNKTLNINEAFIGQKINSLELTEYINRGFYGLTYKAVDNFGKMIAVKLISKRAYQLYNKDFKEEAEKFATLPDSPTIAKYGGAGDVVLKFINQDICQCH